MLKDAVSNNISIFVWTSTQSEIIHIIVLSNMYIQIMLYPFKASVHQQLSRKISMSSISNERFGTSEGGSGWSWDKGGIGMGGKEAGI